MPSTEARRSCQISYLREEFRSRTRREDVKTATRIAIGLVITACLFGLLIFLVGIEEFVDAATSIKPQLAAAILSTVAVRRLFHGMILYAAFARFGVEITYLQAVFLSASVSFMKAVTPFAQLSGEPLAAGIITQSLNETYEASLATISMVEAIKVIPSLSVFAVGSIYFTIFPTRIPPSITPMFALFGLLLLLIPIFGVVLWKYREPAESFATAVFVTVGRGVSVLPRVPRLDEESIRERVRGFSSRFFDLLSHRRLVLEVTALTFGTLFLTVLVFWLALQAVGVVAPIPIVMFAIPFSKLASVIPSPGGVGGTEGVLVIFITTLTANSAESVTTAVIISSGASYWTTAIVGGLGIALVLPLLSDS